MTTEYLYVSPSPGKREGNPAPTPALIARKAARTVLRERGAHQGPTRRAWNRELRRDLREAMNDQ